MNLSDAEALRAFALKIPKVELHLHLEGAIPLNTLLGFIRRAGTEPGIRTVADVRQKLAYADFAHFIDVWVWKNSFITDEKDFDEIAYEVLRDLSAQNVAYVEAFYSPGDYRRRGLSVRGITESLLAGVARARGDFGIRAGLIVDLIRDHGPEVAARRLDEVAPYLGRGVIGVGLGGSEALFPAGPFAEVFREAKSRGFRLVAHAGEAAGPESIWACIDKLGAERIGHGVRAVEDAALLETLRERGIPLEVCVTSNVMTGVVPSVAAHPIRSLIERGVMVTVNSDDPTMFHTTLSDEYAVLVRDLGFTQEALKTLSANGVDASFLPEAEKAGLRATFEEEWRALELDRG
jgi:adenosine deaminase